MRYPLISSLTVLDAVQRDTRISDMAASLEDLQAWAAEAVYNVQAPGLYEEKTLTVEFENYRAPIPKDWAGSKYLGQVRRHYDQLIAPCESGTQRITYYVLPRDEEGYPLIIDLPAMTNSVYWFVCWKLAMLNLLPPTFAPDKCEGKWLNFQRIVQGMLTRPTTNRTYRWSNYPSR